MNYILDIIIILILVIGIIQGANKGFVVTVVSFIGIAAAFCAASFVSQISSDYVYDKTIHPYVIEKLNEKTDEVISQYDPTAVINDTFSEYLDGKDISEVIKNSQDLLDYYNNADMTSLMANEKFSEALDKVYIDIGVKITESMENIVPDEIVNNAKTYFNGNEYSVTDKLDMLTVSKATFADKIESLIIRPVIVKIIGYCIFAIVFALVTLLFNIIGRVLKIVDYLPAISNLNSFLGGLLGALKALIFIAVFVLLCNIFISLTGDENAVISTVSIAQTYVFKWVYYGMFSLFQTFLLKQ